MQMKDITNLESSTTSSFVPKRILVKFNFFISCFTQTSATKTHLEVSPLEYWQRDLFEELQHGGLEAESKDLGPLDPFEALQAFQLLQASRARTFDSWRGIHLPICGSLLFESWTGS